MAVFFQVGPDRISIRPLAFLKPVSIVLIVMLVLMPFVIILLAHQGDPGQLSYKDLAAALIMLPLILACIPLLVLSRRTLIFDRISQTIFTQTLGRKRTLMRFDEAGEIVLMTAIGLYYRLKSKGDRYGKGYRISPYFQGQDKDKDTFDNTLLPAIKAMLQERPAVPATDYALQDAGLLQWYEQCREGYRLKTGKARKQYLPALILLLAALLYFWYRRYFQAVPADAERPYTIILIFPFLLVLAAFTKRICFDSSTRQIIVYRLGFAMARYSRDAFSGFNIVRKTYNGLYNGTDVRLKFRKAGSSREQELTLETFNKTVPIEAFLKETEWVLNH
ncbi:hypothetical protein [Taibaiella helva]|uniref:hypothetical protein n=1 Tax=Taibaiella helva TaxID=2301235 RepID=UPI000E58BD32|nr:hypothetical protein [Taibaiella helva]